MTNKSIQFSLESKDKKKKKEEKIRLERLWFLRNLKKRRAAAAANRKEMRSVLPEIQAAFSK
jgi:protein-arginine kinase